jgi:hypothetical protein
VKIRTPPSLQVQGATYNGSIEPGSNVQLNFNLVNNGDGPAKDLKVSLTQTQGLFTVVGSAEQFVSELAKGDSQAFAYTITIDPEASVGTKLIPIMLSYYDGTRTSSYSETKQIGLPVSGKADFVVTVDSTKNFYFGQEGTVSITIANKGTGSAEYLTAALSSPYGTKEIYVGNLKTDDTEIIDLTQKLVGAPATYNIDVALSYRDSYNNVYNVAKQLSVSPSSAPVQIPFTTIIIIAVVIAAAYFFLKKRRR